MAPVLLPGFWFFKKRFIPFPSFCSNSDGMATNIYLYALPHTSPNIGDGDEKRVGNNWHNTTSGGTVDDGALVAYDWHSLG